jgi:hypothetical protein
LIFDNALIVFSGQFLVFSELKMGGIFKKQCKQNSGSVPIFFGWVRLGADILHNNPYNFQGDCVGCWE